MISGTSSNYVIQIWGGWGWELNPPSYVAKVDSTPCTSGIEREPSNSFTPIYNCAIPQITQNQ